MRYRPRNLLPVMIAMCALAGRASAQDDPSQNLKPLAPRLVDDLAGWVSDRTGMPSDGYQRSDEYKAYCRTLLTARFVSDEAFARSAVPDVTFAHLFEEPEKYRGEVLRFQGRLRRVRKFDAPEIVRSEIPNIYECGIFDLHRYGAHPLIAVVSDLPPGLPVAEELDVPVTVYGYFFKRMRYEAGDSWRDAPLLIGRTVKMEPGHAIAPSGDTNRLFSRDLVLAAVILISISVAVMFVLSWWYRRDDQRVRALIAARRTVSADDFEDGIDAPLVTDRTP